MKKRKLSVSGGCQCGAVRYHTDVMLDNSHLCHCRMCQKAVGNIFAALVATPKSALRWTRGAPAEFQSSDHAMRGFCAACGTPLYYKALDNDRINLTIGSLDKPEKFAPKIQMSMESRLSWFETLAALPDEGETGAGDNADWAASIERSNRQHPDCDTDEWPKR
ncbi:MAG TPA: GFA family protein [Parvularculaceae bacterium]|nr:GFA family protein [Parvularculaceae bacterium]